MASNTIFRKTNTDPISDQTFSVPGVSMYSFIRLLLQNYIPEAKGGAH